MEYIYSYIKTFLPANTKKDASLSFTFQNSDELDNPPSVPSILITVLADSGHNTATTIKYSVPLKELNQKIERLISCILFLAMMVSIGVNGSPGYLFH